MGRWAQAERTGQALAVGTIGNYDTLYWADIAGFWTYVWTCPANPIRWEMLLERFSGAVWVAFGLVTAPGATRSIATGRPVGDLLRVRIRPYTARGFGVWTEKLYS